MARGRRVDLVSRRISTICRLRRRNIRFILLDMVEVELVVGLGGG
jgi:hypothetical protein